MHTTILATYADGSQLTHTVDRIRLGVPAPTSSQGYWTERLDAAELGTVRELLSFVPAPTVMELVAGQLHGAALELLSIGTPWEWVAPAIGHDSLADLFAALS